MKQKDIYIHIGYPKTGTTTLQNYLFPEHSQIDYVRSKGSNFSFITDVFYSRENAFKKKKTEIKKELEAYSKSCKTNKIVYSEESFTSFSMFFRFEPIPYIYTLEPNSIARKLGCAFIDTNVFNSSKVILTIRRQDELLKSMYAQVYNLAFKRFSHTNSFQKFLKYAFSENSDGFILDAINYNDSVLEYEKIFGNGNVCVLVYEEFKLNPKNYIKKLASFIGVDEQEAMNLIENKHDNKRSSESGYMSDERNLKELINYYKNKLLGKRQLGIKARWLHRLLESVYVPGRKLIDISFDEGQIKYLNEMFAEGNQSLSDRHQLDLCKYGYFIKNAKSECDLE